ncbi:MAG: ornithine cyclodeaminase family protein [Chitinophagaceae bacterium]
MEPLFINNQRISELLPMDECIGVMREMFRSLAEGEIVQPLRSVMWRPDRKGLLGMMPGFAAGPGVMGIKVITVFHKNGQKGLPSHQGMVILFDANNGQPLMTFDASEITAIRTAAASAVATELLSRRDSSSLAIIGSGVQAMKHVEAICTVRNIATINIWSRQGKNAEVLAEKIRQKYSLNVFVSDSVQKAAKNADIVCTVTAASQPVLCGEWLQPGMHINAVGASTSVSREIDSDALLRSSLFTDKYESLFNEAGDFVIPEKEGLVSRDFVKAELGEVLTGKKNGRTNEQEITLYKSLGIAAEDIYSAWHIYKKLKGNNG